MNANELANYLNDFIYSEVDYDEDKHNQAQLMLSKLEGQLAFRIDVVMKYQAKVEEQQAEIEALKDEVAMWKMSYENNIRMEDGYGLN